MIVITITAPDRTTADRLAGALVERRQAACVQVSGPITSTYRWQGATETAEEWLVVAKTVAERFAAVEQTLAEFHPYDTPELIATPITQASAAYAAWVAANTAPQP
ncbi:MAG: divalent-cation tolerance protein CutA [Planctomycetota bacterium]